MDKIELALASIRAIRSIPPSYPEPYVSERIVIEYHAALDLLENIGHNTDAFRIPPQDIVPRIERWTSFRPPERSQPIYSEDRWVRRDLFVIKLDTVLGYFAIRESSGPGVVEFRGPQRPGRQHV